MLVNLTENALKYAGTGVAAGQPRVQLETYPETRQGVAGGVVVVSDNGPGIPPEHRARVFQPSFTTNAGSGGVGLFLARDAASGCGGRLELEDRPRGACFAVSLPAGGPA